VARRDWSTSLPTCLTCLSSPRRASDIQSSPRAGEAGRANGARLYGRARVRPACIRQVNRPSANASHVHRHEWTCCAHAKASARAVSGSLHIEPKARIKGPAVAWNIDFVCDSPKAPAGLFLRRPLNLNSHNHNQRDRTRRFYLAVLIERLTFAPRYDISLRRNRASHVSPHAIHARFDRSWMRWLPAAELSCAR
jgi:hypothetical protein